MLMATVDENGNYTMNSGYAGPPQIKREALPSEVEKSKPRRIELL